MATMWLGMFGPSGNRVCWRNRLLLAKPALLVGRGLLAKPGLAGQTGFAGQTDRGFAGQTAGGFAGRGGLAGQTGSWWPNGIAGQMIKLACDSKWPN